MPTARKTLLLLAASVLTASAQSLAAGETPDLSGLWELRADSRSVPPAQLTNLALRAAARQRYQDLEGLRWCRQAGLPIMMETPLNIRQGTREVAIVSPMVSPARHVYIDGRKQVDLGDYEATVVGNSVGHWESGVLVVETIGFSDRGIVSIPGGGYRNSRSVLSERYRLSPDGNELYVRFTWQDGSVFLKSHSYEFRYHRVPSETNIREWPCEPSDADRAKFFAPALDALKTP